MAGSHRPAARLQRCRQFGGLHLLSLLKVEFQIGWLELGQNHSLALLWYTELQFPCSRPSFCNGFLLLSPKFFWQKQTKRTHGEKIFTGIGYELPFQRHLNIRRESDWDLSFPMNFSYGLQDFARDRCFWQLFLTRLLQTLSHLILVSFLLFQLRLLHWTQLRFVKSIYQKQTSWIRGAITQFLSRIPCPAYRLPNFSRFVLLVSVQYAAHQPMHPTMNCLQLFCSLIYGAFSCHALSIVTHPVGGNFQVF